MVIFGQKPWKNVNLSTFRTSCFYSLERLFFVLEYSKRHFPGLSSLKKKFVKMAIFGQKPWVNPFRKMSIFRLFELLVFIAQKSFFFLEYRERHFPSLNCLKKKFGKMAISGTKPWLNPFKKMPVFFDFLNFLFLQPRKAIFCSRIS